jgi:hypothetical protein
VWKVKIFSFLLAIAIVVVIFLLPLLLLISSLHPDFSFPYFIGLPWQHFSRVSHPE